MFAWAELDRELIIRSLFSKRHFLLKKMPIKKFHQKISYQLKKIAKIKTDYHHDSKIEKNLIYVGGSYCSESDQENKTAITIDFYYNNKFKSLNLSELSYFQLCVTIADIMIHEIIHMRQHRKRNFRNVKEYKSSARTQEKRMTQNYLGHKDEIEAYSFNIACEIRDKFKDNEEKIRKFLDGDIKIKSNKMTCYQQYLKAFDRDWKHPVMISLKKQIINNLPKAKIGKPYRNDYYIWY